MLENKRFNFAEFELDGSKRLLSRNGEVCTLSPKAIDLLLVFVEKQGEVLYKTELLDLVWDGRFVEENNLTVHISNLRKALGDVKGKNQFIVTIPGRGYSFVADVKRIESADVKKVGSVAAIEIPKNRAEIRSDHQISLIGRSKEIIEIKNLLRHEDAGLITLTGAGGTGKTSLARSIADQMTSDFPDGIYFVELASIRNPEHVLSEIIKTTGTVETEDSLTIEALKSRFYDRRSLLILDNFEQVLSAASYVDQILKSLPLLKILITSRLAIPIKSGQEVFIAPLSVPPATLDVSAETLVSNPAVSLFIIRASETSSNFKFTNENSFEIAEICRRLDGLPLAIELAAARVRLLSPEEILVRLNESLNLLTGGDRELSERQRTMRGAIEWSYELLDEGEKEIFRQLAVFEGGFTIAAAEYLAKSNDDAIPKTVSTLDHLTSLLENNLLTRSGGRLKMLEVVREFASELLANSGENDQISRTHAKCFIELAEESETQLLGESSINWLEKLEEDNDNLRGALEWSLKNDVDGAKRLAAALRYFWSNRNHLSEGRKWLELVLESCDEENSITYLKILNGLGQFARYQNDLETARRVYEKSMAAGIEANQTAQVGVAYHGLAALAIKSGDFVEAKEFNEKELAIYRDLKDESGVAYALASLGDLALASGNASDGRPFIEESLEISRKLGNRQVVSINLVNLGIVEFNDQDYYSASSHFLESLELAQSLGNMSLVSCSLDGFAAISERNGLGEDAAKLSGAADELRRSIGFGQEPAEILFCESYTSKIVAAIGKESYEASFEIGKRLDLEKALSLVHQISTRNREAVIANFAAEDQDTDVGQFNEIILQKSTKTRVTYREETVVQPLLGGKVRSLFFRNSTAGKPYFLIGSITASVLVALFLVVVFLKAGATKSIFFGSNSSNAGAYEPRRLTTNGKVVIGTLTPDGKRFSFVTNNFGEQALWLGQTDGGNELELIEPKVRNYSNLVFSKDGSTLYFSYSDEANPSSALFRMPSNGGVQEKLLDGISGFALSSDSKKIAVGRFNNSEKKFSIVEIDLESKSESEIISFTDQRLVPASISYSPDNSKIAFALNMKTNEYEYGVYVLDLAEKKERKLTDQYFGELTKTYWAKEDEITALGFAGNSWSSVPQFRIWKIDYQDGKARKITSDLSSYTNSLSIAGDSMLSVEHRQLNNVWIAPFDDLSSAKQITFSAFGRYDGLWGLDFTPDGGLVLLSADTKSTLISVMNSDGLEARQLTTQGFVDSVISATRDGRYIVFHSTRSGNGFDIWRMNIDGSNPVQLTHGGKSYQPFPSPDSRYVYYKGWLTGVGELRRVPIDGGESEALNDKETSWLSFSPDGSMFAAAYNTDKSRLAVFSAANNTLIRQFDFPKGGSAFMGSRWSPDGKFVLYRDFNYGYWQQSIEGGEPERLEGLPKAKFYNFTVSKDGKWFAFVGGQEMRDLVLFRNEK